MKIWLMSLVVGTFLVGCGNVAKEAYEEIEPDYDAAEEIAEPDLAVESFEWVDDGDWPIRVMYHGMQFPISIYGSWESGHFYKFSRDEVTYLFNRSDRSLRAIFNQITNEVLYGEVPGLNEFAIGQQVNAFRGRSVFLTPEEQAFVTEIESFYERYGARKPFQTSMASLEPQVEMPIIFYHGFAGKEDLLHFSDWSQIDFEFPDLEALSWHSSTSSRIVQRWRVEVVSAQMALDELLNISLETEQSALLVVIEYEEAWRGLFDSQVNTTFLIWPGMPFELVDGILSMAEPVLVESSDVNGILTETFRWTRPERVLDWPYFYMEVTFENSRVVDLTTNVVGYD